MTKSQHTSIILIAFGIISILLTQLDSKDVRAESVAQVSKDKVSDNKVSDSTNFHISAENVNAIAHAENPLFITNIYDAKSGSFYFAEDDSGYVASDLLKTDAQISITGPIARTRLTQVFVNNTNQVRSGIYVFPLPQDAAVDALLMEVGERKIEGEIKPKILAKKIFEKAQAEGKKASLVEQIRPNIFSNRLANIPPNTEVAISIEYQQLIRQEKNQYSLRLPLSITPRYQAQKPEDTSQGYSNSDESLNHLVAQTHINVSLDTGFPIAEISSEHHPIKTHKPSNTEYKIELDTEKLVNKDFVLNWQVQPAYHVQASHFRYEADNHQYGLISIVPPAKNESRAKRNLVFVLDVSGSMLGEALTQAKQALAYAINDLSDDDYFNIITFSSDSSRIWSHSQQASKQHKESALNYLYTLEASGGTEIKKALNMAFALPNVAKNVDEDGAQTYLDQILFITDGSVNNEDELMQLIYRSLGDYRLFTVGIGNAPNGFFMQEAASAGKGTYTYIGNISKLKNKMSVLLEKLKYPALSDLRLNIKDAQEAFGFEIYPSILPDVYANEALTISYRRKIDDTHTNKELPFTIEGTYLSSLTNQTNEKGENQNNENEVFRTELPAMTVNHKRGIHKYWARMKIQDLSRQLNMRSRFGEGYQQLKQNVKKGITEIALSHHLVSKYTSLVAIDHKPEHKPTAHKLNTKHHAFNKPNNIPAQYANSRLLQTASPSLLYLIYGLASFVVAGLIFTCRPCR